MALVRISVDDNCKDGYTCRAVWSDENDSEYAIVIGEAVEPAPVPLGPGEVAFRVRRQVIRDAEV